MWVLVALLVTSCGVKVDQALDSDANGYLCRKCQAKFYSDRSVFATRCPDCKEGNPETVLGFVCPDDQQVTFAPRGKGMASCSKCGKTVQGISIPREVDLKKWGATKRTSAEVGG